MAARASRVGGQESYGRCGNYVQIFDGLNGGAPGFEPGGWCCRRSKGARIWLRRMAKPDEEQQRIFHQLQLQLPEPLEPIQIQKCSADSAVA